MMTTSMIVVLMVWAVCNGSILDVIQNRSQSTTGVIKTSISKRRLGVCLSCDFSCFPSTASLNLENGKVVAMSELQIGDWVPTVSSVGTFTYSKVRAFLKNQYSMTSMYKSIFTSWNYSITLTGNHLIYARKSYTSKFNPIFADQVSIGDEVLALGSDELTPVKVINMSINQMQGAFMPLTTEGNIVVDGIMASCHASTHHDLAYFGTVPMQWFPEILGWLFGKEDETQVYVNIAEKLGKWVLPYNSMYKEGSVLDTVI